VFIRRDRQPTISFTGLVLIEMTIYDHKIDDYIRPYDHQQSTIVRTYVPLEKVYTTVSEAYVSNLTVHHI
jgi:hypothetical protein